MKNSNLAIRSHSLDLIRVVACLLVVGTHAPMAGEAASQSGFFLGSLAYIVRPCIGLFLMISGALLLPIRQCTEDFLSRRLRKIVYPTIFWSILYIVIRNPHETIVEDVFSIPFSYQGHPALWYMYTLVGLYLLAPIISSWLKHCTCRELNIYLSLWGVTLCYPILNLFISIDISTMGILYYFTGYSGYFILGYYIKRFGARLNYRIITIGAGICYIVPVVYRIWPVAIEQNILFGYCSIFVAIITLFWYVTLIKIMTKIETSEAYHGFVSWIEDTAVLSFGIYFVHALILEQIVWKMSLIQNISNYALQTFAIWLITFVLSLWFSRIISLLPFAKYIIGNKRFNNFQDNKDSNLRRGGNWLWFN